MPQQEGMPLILERVDFLCDSQTGVPLTACHPEWHEEEGPRAIAQKIEDILDRYQPGSWGLACPAFLYDRITDQIRHCHEKKLCTRLATDVDQIHVGNVAQLFHEAVLHQNHPVIHAG